MYSVFLCCLAAQLWRNQLNILVCICHVLKEIKPIDKRLLVVCYFCV